MLRCYNTSQIFLVLMHSLWCAIQNKLNIILDFPKKFKFIGIMENYENILIELQNIILLNILLLVVVLYIFLF